MSTVAYRNGIMAADSACWSNGTYIGDSEKIRLVGDTLIGCCGNLDAIELFFKFYRKKTQDAQNRIKELTEHTFSALCVSPKGDVSEWNNLLVPVRYVADYYAIGSGEEYALGAMAMGAAAEQAVRAAAHHDAHTRLPVVVMKLGGER
jgi:ATP-dependent protease HslVU (ClpYQ) peptidase subunit